MSAYYRTFLGSVYRGQPGHDYRPDRPVVVIDPEDREAVERLYYLAKASLRFLAMDSEGQDRAHELFASALRSFANPPPPKLDEPTGRYAVVEDRGGLEWVRADLGDGFVWKCLTDTEWREYDGIDVVRVLSPGVQ